MLTEIHRIRKSLFLFLFTFGSIITGNSSIHKAGVYQLTKHINGKQVCFGVIIQLDKQSFKKNINHADISIIEAKHSKQIKYILTWSVDKSQKRLIIKFRNKTGDFGTGNFININIRADAFTGEHIENFTAVISTDPI